MCLLCAKSRPLFWNSGNIYIRPFYEIYLPILYLKQILHILNLPRMEGDYRKVDYFNSHGGQVLTYI